MKVPGERRRRGDALWRLMTGEGKPPSVSDPAEAITWVYGRNRLGNPNVGAAAADMGVSESTIRRWIHPDPERRSTPTLDHARAVKRLTRRATRRRNADPEFRRSLMQRRVDRMSQTGAVLNVVATMQISADVRQKKTGDQQLPPEAAALLNDAWASGDQKAFNDTLEELVFEHYFKSAVPAHIVDLDELDFRPT